jgi:DNA-binding Lrp family transcriptional regulator
MNGIQSMRKAFVLINTDLGSENELLSELKKIEGLVESYAVYGIYDVVAEIEVESEQQVKEIVFSRIRTLKHVRSTLTLTVI